MSLQIPFAVLYKTVPASATGTVLGATGAKGDVLVSLTITVSVTLTSTVSILDGATSYAIMAASTPIGVYNLVLNAQSVIGAWSVTTGAGVTVLAVGKFS